MLYKLISIKKSDKEGKKLMAIFENKKTKRTKKVHFGSYGMSDYTKHKDSDRKDRYLKRHKKNEDWNNPLTPGALSRWILWNKPSMRESIESYKRRFFR